MRDIIHVLNVSDRYKFPTSVIKASGSGGWRSRPRNVCPGPPIFISLLKMSSSYTAALAGPFVHLELDRYRWNREKIH